MSVPYGNSQPPQDPSPQPGYPMGAPAYGVPYGAPQMAMLPPELAALPGASFGEAVRRFFHRYAQFRGAASVSEVLWPWLLQILVVGGCMAVGLTATVAGAIPARDGAESTVEPWAIIIMMICGVAAMAFGLAIIVPSISVEVRRLHDIGKSGGWWFIRFVPLIGMIWLLVLLLSSSKPELFRPEWA